MELFSGSTIYFHTEGKCHHSCKHSLKNWQIRFKLPVVLYRIINNLILNIKKCQWFFIRYCKAKIRKNTRNLSTFVLYCWRMPKNSKLTIYPLITVVLYRTGTRVSQKMTPMMFCKNFYSQWHLISQILHTCTQQRYTCWPFSVFNF